MSFRAHIASENEMAADLVRALRLIHPRYEQAGELLFACATEREKEQWQFWVREIGQLSVFPAVLDSWQAARMGHARKLEEIDTALSARLPRLTSQSRLAGRRLLLDYEAPGGDRVAKRFRRVVSQNPELGHYPVVFGLRAALFGINPLILITAYGYLELVSARLTTRQAECLAWALDAARGFLETRTPFTALHAA